MPARPAIATRCTMALVEPPIAMQRDDGVVERLLRQEVARLQVLPDHLDDALAASASPCAEWFESGAGIDDAPGSVKPERSRRATSWSRPCPWSCRCPASARCRPRSRASRCSVMLPARSSAQYFQVSEPQPSVLAAPVAAQHRPGRQIDRRQVHADRAHDQRRAWSCRSRPSAPRRRPDRSAAAPRSPSPGGCGTAWWSASDRSRPATSPASRPGSRPPARRRASPPRRAA